MKVKKGDGMTITDIINLVAPEDWDIIEHLDAGEWNEQDYISKFLAAYKARYGVDFTPKSRVTSVSDRIILN